MSASVYLAKQIGVRFQRIVDFNLWGLALAGEGVKLAGGIVQRDAEIVDAIESA